MTEQLAKAQWVQAAARQAEEQHRRETAALEECARHAREREEAEAELEEEREEHGAPPRLPHAPSSPPPSPFPHLPSLPTMAAADVQLLSSRLNEAEWENLRRTAGRLLWFGRRYKIFFKRWQHYWVRRAAPPLPAARAFLDPHLEHLDLVQFLSQRLKPFHADCVVTRHRR